MVAIVFCCRYLIEHDTRPGQRLYDKRQWTGVDGQAQETDDDNG